MSSFFWGISYQVYLQQVLRLTNTNFKFWFLKQKTQYWICLSSVGCTMQKVSWMPRKLFKVGEQRDEAPFVVIYHIKSQQVTGWSASSDIHKKISSKTKHFFLNFRICKKIIYDIYIANTLLALHTIFYLSFIFCYADLPEATTNGYFNLIKT